MQRALIDFIIRLSAWVKRKQILTPEISPVKINLGSGLMVAEDWINIDGSPNALFAGWPKPALKAIYRTSGSNKVYSQHDYIAILKNHQFVFHDLHFNIPLASGTVDFIYTSHMLEHFCREDARRLLQEALRVLKNNGLLRICVPDLKYAISQYTMGEKEKALTYFFAPSRSGQYAQHRYMYDFELLKELLSGVGFKEILQRGYKSGHIPDVEKLDNRPEETLYVEASK